MVKKTTLLVLFLVLASSFISGCTEKKQTEENVASTGGTLPPRSYPSYIKGVWEPIPYPDQYEMIKHDLDRLKEDGVNTVYIIPIYPENSPPPEYKEKTIIDEIKKVRQKGFAVFLCPDVSASNPGNVDDFLYDLKQFDLKWAEIAEKYSVEYFSPGNELYMVLMEKLGYKEDSIEAEQLWNKIDLWHQDVLQEIKNVYTGKVCYKPAFIGFNWDINTITLTGYDILAPNLPVGGNTVEEFEEWLDFVIPLIINVSKRDNVEWMVGEYWIPSGVPISLCQAGLDKIENATIPSVGFAFGGWTCEDGTVKDTIYEETIKNWWSKK